MSRPSPIAYLIGNNFSCACAVALTGYTLLLLAQASEASLPVVFACLILDLGALRSRQRLADYGRRQEVSEAAAGNMAFARQFTTRVRLMSAFTCAAVWTGCSLWLFQNPQQEHSLPYDVSLLLWGVATVAALFSAARGIVNLARSAHSRRKSTTIVHPIVTQCLRVPARSPSLPDIIDALPHYAASCLEEADDS